MFTSEGENLAWERLYFVSGLEKDFFWIPSFLVQTKKLPQNGYVRGDALTRDLSLGRRATVRATRRPGARMRAWPRIPIIVPKRKFHKGKKKPQPQKAGPLLIRPVY